jgi:hypothetical protein
VASPRVDEVARLLRSAGFGHGRGTIELQVGGALAEDIASLSRMIRCTTRKVGATVRIAPQVHD